MRVIDGDALRDKIVNTPLAEGFPWDQEWFTRITDMTHKILDMVESAPEEIAWHEWSEKPERSGSFVVLISNSWSRALNKDVAFYDALFEEWSIILEGDETPRYWMRLPEPPEWNPEWDKDLLVDVEEENE